MPFSLFRPNNIVQEFKPLIYKDLMSKVYSLTALKSAESRFLQPINEVGFHAARFCCENGNTIQGKWQILIFRGAWEAQRIDDNLSLEQTSRTVEKIPVAISGVRSKLV